MSKKVIYKFPAFKGGGGHIQTGYSQIQITNGEATVDESDVEKVKLFRDHGGLPSRAAAPAKAQRAKSK